MAVNSPDTRVERKKTHNVKALLSALLIAANVVCGTVACGGGNYARVIINEKEIKGFVGYNVTTQEIVDGETINQKNKVIVAKANLPNGSFCEGLKVGGNDANLEEYLDPTPFDEGWSTRILIPWGAGWETGYLVGTVVKDIETDEAKEVTVFPTNNGLSKRESGEITNFFAEKCNVN